MHCGRTQRESVQEVVTDRSASEALHCSDAHLRPGPSSFNLQDILSLGVPCDLIEKGVQVVPDFRPCDNFGM